MIRSLPNCSHKICQNGESTNTQPTKCSSCGDVSVQLMYHGCLTVTSHYHLTQEYFNFQLRQFQMLFTCCSRSCLATSLAELPDTSIQVLLKKAQLPSMKVM